MKLIGTTNENLNFDLGVLKRLKLTAVYFQTTRSFSRAYPTRLVRIAVCGEFNVTSLSNIPLPYLFNTTGASTGLPR